MVSLGLLLEISEGFEHKLKLINRQRLKNVSRMACNYIHIYIIDEGSLPGFQPETLRNKTLKLYPYLKFLEAAYHLKISDKGIKNLQLCGLDVSENYRITDKGIKHMKIHWLATNSDSVISYQKMVELQTNGCKVFYDY